MNCPGCLTTGLGPGYIASFTICGLFFILGLGVLFWASRNGKLDGLDDTKFAMLQDED